MSCRQQMTRLPVYDKFEDKFRQIDSLIFEFLKDDGIRAGYKKVFKIKIYGVERNINVKKS